jgi:hypothetical protein
MLALELGNRAEPLRGGRAKPSQHMEESQPAAFVAVFHACVHDVCCIHACVIDDVLILFLHTRIHEYFFSVLGFHTCNT